MEMPGRRSNYALLSQNPDEPVAQRPLYSGEKTNLKFDRINQAQSGSSFGESSLDISSNLSEFCGWSSSKSWAQQTEESYQLQLALAIRLSSEATCADDPNFLDPVPDQAASIASSSPASAEAISHRYWVTLSLDNNYNALTYLS